MKENIKVLTLFERIERLNPVYTISKYFIKFAQKTFEFLFTVKIKSSALIKIT